MFKRTVRGAGAIGLAAVLAVSCSSGHKPVSSAGGGAGNGTSTSTAAGQAGGAIGAGSGDVAQGSPQSTAPATTVYRSGAPAAPAPGTPATRVGASAVGAATTAPKSGSGSSPPGSAPSPAAPGTYTMSQSGSVTYGTVSQNEPAQGTLVVDPAQPDGVQLEHRYISSNSSPADTKLQFLPTGPVIISTTEGGQGNVTCTFSPPIAAPPWPPAVGKSFSSQGSCGNGSTVKVSGQITGSQTDTLMDGETFTVWVVSSTLQLSGQITASGNQVDWYSPALRLPVHEHVHVTGNYNNVPFTLDSTGDLASSHPS